MSLRYKLGKARRLLAALSTDEKIHLRLICESIRKAQEVLLDSALPAMQQCLHNCGGLCCRNARVDDIIGLMDIVFILTLTPEFEDTMTVRAAREKPFYSADCMFLGADGGPCIFISAVRPEVCITTFCSGDRHIQSEIRDVKRLFRRLNGFFIFRQPRAACKALKALLPTSQKRPKDPVWGDADHHRLNVDRGTHGERKT